MSTLLKDFGLILLGINIVLGSIINHQQSDRIENLTKRIDQIEVQK